MSNEARDWAWQQKTRHSTEKLVLIALAQFADREGRKVFPAINRIAGMVDLSDRQVQRVLRSLEQQRLVITEQAGSGRGKTTRYELPLKGVADVTVPDLKGDTDDTQANPERVTPRALKGDMQGTKGCHPCHPTPLEPVLIPPRGRERAPASPTPPARAARTMPLDFSPNEEGEALALSLGLDLGRTLRMFRSWYGSEGVQRADWQAAWRMWCDRERDFARSADADERSWTENPFLNPSAKVRLQ